MLIQKSALKIPLRLIALALVVAGAILGPTAFLLDLSLKAAALLALREIKAVLLIALGLVILLLIFFGALGGKRRRSRFPVSDAPARRPQSSDWGRRRLPAFS
jgi:hypothetical protein